MHINISLLLIVFLQNDDLWGKQFDSIQQFDKMDACTTIVK